MQVAIPSQGVDLEAPISLKFDNCQSFIFVDTESGLMITLPNPANQAPNDAGVQAAQFVIEQGAQAVIVAMIGQHAQQTLQKAGVKIYERALESGREAFAHLQAGKLYVMPEI